MERLHERLSLLERGWSDDLPRLTRYEYEAEKSLLRLITGGKTFLTWGDLFRSVSYAICGFTPPVDAVFRRYERDGVLRFDDVAGGWRIAVE